MEGFLKEGIEGNDLEELNRCRLFLKYTCLLDISTGDEKTISVMAWNGIQNIASSRYEWSTQQKPHQKIWGRWQAGLHSTYSLIRTLTLTKNIQLGPWLHLGLTGWV